MTPLFKKLNLGSNDTMLVLNAPASFEAETSQLTGVTILRKATSTLKIPFALGFALTQDELDRISSAIVRVEHIRSMTRHNSMAISAEGKRRTKG